jgi:hypothetical protein
MPAVLRVSLMHCASGHSWYDVMLRQRNGHSSKVSCHESAAGVVIIIIIIMLPIKP